jgi:1-acyl-sn-glycerol-3-phosphate acyltransferase
VPCAITGTEALFFGPFPKPRRVQIAFAEPILVEQLAPTPEVAGDLIAGTLWPEVTEEYRRLRARPTLIAAALAAVGIGGGVLLRSRRKR